MSNALSHAFELSEDAARLIRYGLLPRIRPSADSTYRELLRRFRTDSRLREQAEAVARGLGLMILGATDHGLVLAAEDDGPFAMRLADYHGGQNRTVTDRMCQGLIQLAIAAWCFPRADDLFEGDSVLTARITVDALVQYLVQLCEDLKSHASESDSLHAQPELQEAWRVILSRAETRLTKQGRRSPTSLAGMVAHALAALERAGLMRRIGNDNEECFQALASYRLQARELAAHESFLLIRRIRNEGCRDLNGKGA